ncbi:hypothetical protein ACFLV8_00090 [Chloroflexota bacterium]
MAYHWEDREKLKASLGSAGLWGHTCWFLGVIFAVLGVIADAVNINLGLTPISWLLLAIAAFLAGIPCFMSIAMMWYLKTTGRKKEE